MNNSPLLALNQISLKHHQQSLLDDVSLSLSARKTMTIIGPNGAGKSTLVKIALGLVKPDSGTVFRQANLRIGYMPQRLSLNPLMPLSVERFLAMANTRNIDTALERTGISHLRKRPLHDISGGETQRVLLSRALLSEPDLLVLDEPA